MTQPVLGILTLYLNDEGRLEEKGIYQKMTVAGRRLGLDVIVFTPKDVNHSEKRIHSHVFNPETKNWSRKWTAFPDMIYDRCRIQRSYRFDQLISFRSKYKHLNFLNRPLRNKWTVHRTLSKDARYKSYLPATKYVDSVKNVIEMLERYPLVYVKPINGTGGRGILRIERRSTNRLLVQGRNHSRTIIKPRLLTKDGLTDYLADWNLSSKRYIVQQGIQLKLHNGRVHDYRLLVQKNGSGNWESTGCAGRIGAEHSITSNLHGGGQAMVMDSLLKSWLQDDTLIRKVKEETSKLGTGIAAYLEQSYGRLCELALDIAIDQRGKIWLLEVNPKPAREVFIQAGELDVYNKAIKRPLEYALWLSKQKQATRRRKTVASGESRMLEDDDGDYTDSI